MSDPDVLFWFDPVCPFAWMTSKWVRMVREQRDYSVEWRFISLRLVNKDVDYDSHFPPEYEAGHTAGLRLLRVAAAARAEHGPDSVDRLYRSYGGYVFERGRWDGGSMPTATPDTVAPLLVAAGLPDTLAGALDDRSWDERIQAETDEALGLTGKDVGTPILQFEPPDGVAFFGPVISRLPSPEQAVELWDHVIGLARFGGFAELKRSLREQPQLPSFGVAADEVGKQEDWHGGSRRLKK
jgi:2-hydroxychromene-2-carboxylate isomerase